VLETLTKITIFAMEIIVGCHVHTGIATKSLNHRDLLPDLTKITILGRVVFHGISENTNNNIFETLESSLYLQWVNPNTLETGCLAKHPVSRVLGPVWGGAYSAYGNIVA